MFLHLCNNDKKSYRFSPLFLVRPRKKMTKNRLSLNKARSYAKFQLFFFRDK